MARVAVRKFNQNTNEYIDTLFRSGESATQKQNSEEVK